MPQDVQCHDTGTAFYRLRSSAETVSLVLTLLAHGCPLQAIVVAFGSDERTVADGVARAGGHGQAVQEHLVEYPRDLGQVQADESRVKKQGGIVWMALAMMVATRLWLGGTGSEQRAMPLIRRLIERVKRCAARRPLLICTDGLVSSIRAIRETLPYAHLAPWHVSDRDRRELLHTVRESGPRWKEDHTGHGGGHRCALLECSRTVVVPRTAASLDTTQATWASLVCAQTPY